MGTDTATRSAAGQCGGVAAQEAPMPTPTPPYQFIAIARTIARGFTEQAATHPEGEALTEAARAIWRGVEALEGMDRRKPDETRSMRSVRRALSTTPTPIPRRVPAD
jgi:hypothetical protein